MNKRRKSDKKRNVYIQQPMREKKINSHTWQNYFPLYEGQVLSHSNCYFELDNNWLKTTVYVDMLTLY